MPDLFGSTTLSVPLSAELARVSKIPRRTWSAERVEEVARELTAALKTPGGTMELRPKQAVALYEVGEMGGLFGVLRCGSGKTLVSLLAPVMVDAKNPLLLVPAALVEKTRRDSGKLAEHWHLPEKLTVRSYELLGQAQAAEMLDEIDPDFVVCDEAHKLKHLSSARSRRVRRWFNAHRGVGCVAMSGTMTRRSLLDFAHVIRWCLPAHGVPLPHSYNDLEQWADALDERASGERGASPGALKILCGPDELAIWDVEPRRAARLAYRRRLVETAGVVATAETEVDASLTVRSVEPPVAPAVEEAFARLRRDWETPDGWPVSDAITQARHARELAAGFFYFWSPRPPRHWLEARRAWCAFVRKVLSHSRSLDSEKQVKDAHPAAPELLGWQRVAGDFEPTTVAQWVDDGVVRYAAEWAERERGIVWVEQTCFGERLEDEYGLSYYGDEGRTRAGAYIEDHPPGEPLAASVHSNREGVNLQAWAANLITCPMPNGERLEQVLSRTHRDGQKADEVTVDVVVACAEHLRGFWTAVRECEYVYETTGSPQKLLVAGIDVPRPEAAFRFGPRWETKK